MSDYDRTVEFWQKKNIKNTSELELALNGHLISFAYHSGKLENENITYNDTREIFEHDGVTSYTGDLKTLFEIRNAKDATTFILNAYEQKMPMDLKFIQELQYELTKGTYDTRRYQLGERPGKFKKHDYVTGREEVGALPEDVPMELSELLNEISTMSFDSKEALTAAAYFHVKFENIHPFADGNGRTGRWAMNYLLIQHNHPPTIIHEEDRKLYYNSLEAWDTAQDLKPMKLFLKMEVTKTWQKQIVRQTKHIFSR